MKLSDRHTRIAILMVVSQALLIGFTLYWLRGQYLDERNNLYEKLTLDYTESKQVVIDSMLLDHYIKPALGDSLKVFRGIRISGQSVCVADTTATEMDTTKRIALISGDSYYTITMTSKGDSIERNIEIKQNAERKELLLRSIKLIIGETNDTTGIPLKAIAGMLPEPDSALFKSDYETRLRSEGLGFEIKWIPLAGDSANGKNEMIINISEKLFPRVSVVGYRAYLLGKIIPQMAFVIILILLTGSAFFLAYRSMKKQFILNMMRNNFVSNMSHELKTPVSTVKVALEAIRKHDLKIDPVVAGEYLDMASRELKRLELLINKVLDNSILEQDGAIINLQRIDISLLIREAIESLKPRTDEAGATVIFEPEGQVEGYADPLYLTGVLLNLFDNSLKYGNGSTVIEVKLAENDRYTTITVTDNGPGIPEAYLKKIFEKFFRVPEKDTHNVKGYGLGLSFASLIVGLHKGTIRARNNERGCSFIISIPKRTH